MNEHALAQDTVAQHTGGVGPGIAAGLLLAIALFALAWRYSGFEPPEVPRKAGHIASVRFEAARLQEGVAGHGAPAASGERAPVTLPHRPNAAKDRHVAYEVEFDMPGTVRTPPPAGLCVTRWSGVDAVWLDGQLLHQPSPLARASRMRHHSEFMALPADLGPGRHRLWIDLHVIPGAANGLSEIWFGEAGAIRDACRHMSEHRIAAETGSLYLMGFVGILALAGALVLRTRNLLYFGLIPAAWVIHKLISRSDWLAASETLDLLSFHATRPLIAAPVVLFTLALTQRLDAKTLRPLALVYAAGYLGLVFLPAHRWLDWLNVFGALLLMVMAWMVVILIRYALRIKSHAYTMLAAALCFGILANASDILRSHGLLAWSSHSMTDLTAPVLCLGILLFVLDQSREYLQKEKRTAASLQNEIDRQRLQLESEFRRARINNEKIAAMEERKRIIRDMHDGLGSQLVSASAVARGPQPNAANLTELIDSSLQELRSFLDTLSIEPQKDGHGNGRALNLLLARLRQRIEPVLRSRHIELVWNISPLPDGFVSSDRARLNLIRLLQETIANAVKHAKPRCIAIGAHARLNTIVIQVADDGAGYDPEDILGNANHGYGIANMYRRAHQLGAILEIRNTQPGTTVRVTVPTDSDNHLRPPA